MEKKTETYYLDFGRKGNIYIGVEDGKTVRGGVSMEELKNFLAMAKRLGIRQERYDMAVCSDCKYWFKKENNIGLDLGGYCRPYTRGAAGKRAEAWCSCLAPACDIFQPRKRKTKKKK